MGAISDQEVKLWMGQVLQTLTEIRDEQRETVGLLELLLDADDDDEALDEDDEESEGSFLDAVKGVVADAVHEATDPRKKRKRS